MRCLLVQPDYYTRYPPLGLLKLSSYYKSQAHATELVRGCVVPSWKPDRIHVTSLFSWAWRPVWRAVRYFKALYPDAELWLGGIYASLLPDHARLSGADNVWVGLFPEAEDLMPDYDLVPEWDGSIIFASRGCIRQCGFCAVPKLEGKPNRLKHGVRDLIYPKHTKVIFFDNNILGNVNWRAVFDELIELGLKVDFNQGLDARLMTDAEKISKIKMPVVRLAYDSIGIGPYVEKAIKHLTDYGMRKRDIIIYTLYNYADDPEDFFHRVRDILNWGATSYPMRYEPLCSLEKSRYVAPKWDCQRLERVMDARRVIGYAGSFPPYKALVEKLNRANSFDEAFNLRPKMKKVSKLQRGSLMEMARQDRVVGSRKKYYFPAGRRYLDWREVLRPQALIAK